MPDTPTPRAVLVRALHEAGAWCGQCDYESDERCADCEVVLTKYADACLAALAASAGPLTAERLIELKGYAERLTALQATVQGDPDRNRVGDIITDLLTSYTALAAELESTESEVRLHEKWQMESANEIAALAAELALLNARRDEFTKGINELAALRGKLADIEADARARSVNAATTADLAAENAALRATVGFTTDKEHRRGCPALSAWDIPGACDCDYPTITRCNQCGARTPTPEGQG